MRGFSLPQAVTLLHTHGDIDEWNLFCIHSLFSFVQLFHLRQLSILCFFWPRLLPNISPCSSMHANPGCTNPAQEPLYHHPEPSGTCRSKFQVQVQGNNTIILSTLNWAMLSLVSRLWPQLQLKCINSSHPSCILQHLPSKTRDCLAAT